VKTRRLILGTVVFAGALSGALRVTDHPVPSASGDILCVAVQQANVGSCLDNPLPAQAPVVGAPKVG